MSNELDLLSGVNLNIYGKMSSQVYSIYHTYFDIYLEIKAKIMFGFLS